MIEQQLVMGAGVSLVCAFGLWHHRWMLANTKKGERLVRWFGDENALWVLRALLLAGVLFGGLLAAGVINPVRW